ncbi:MAG: hypothetical protein R3C02_01720 [Planctomycetaceae bacterium]
MNSLAALNLRGTFGRAEVFQLFSAETIRAAGSGIAKWSEISVWRRHHQPAAERTIRTWVNGQDHQAHGGVRLRGVSQRYAGTAILLFVIGEGGQLRVVTTDEKLSPKPGTVIAIVDPVESLKPEDVGEPSTTSDDT